MVTIINEEAHTEEVSDTHIASSKEENPTLALAKAKDTSNHLLISGKFITHNSKTGLNSLVDSAAYLFSIMGKLKKIKSYRQLSKLRKELIHEINTFQDIVKTHGYSSEYILASRYALCATLDDIISNTSWGAQGQWESHSLLSAFNNHENMSQEKFFIILERIIKDPTLYIDVMEFMYICLSLGFKGNFRATEFNNNQLEQIINSLYKRIRNARGDFSKTLSPYPIKPPMNTPTKVAMRMPLWLSVVLSICTVFTFFAGVRFLLDLTASNAYQELTRTGTTSTYETNHSTAES